MKLPLVAALPTARLLPLTVRRRKAEGHPSTARFANVRQWPPPGRKQDADDSPAQASSSPHLR
ncbi:MAG: hypothetical protein PHQ04_04925 [Opitutaceae bacterium]|nr:hypothetical protein [Opitutaceae bacterium]